MKKTKEDLLLVQVYVNDIIFGSTNASLVESYKETMAKSFNISMLGELNYFLDLQVNQKKEGIEIHQQNL